MQLFLVEHKFVIQLKINLEMLKTPILLSFKSKPIMNGSNSQFLLFDYSNTILGLPQS